MFPGKIVVLVCVLSFATAGFFGSTQTPAPDFESELDLKVRNFLDEHRGEWRDLNVPEADGRVLFDLIVKNGYTRALEIGTSTGHSGIWIAWALSKTGGKLITIEIDERRHAKALANFEAAGLSDFIDAKLADAHDLVPKLEGPFDFVFCDADKEWYTNYFKSVYPKLEDEGCFTAHNVTNSRMSGIREFLDHLNSLPDMETTIDRSSGSGISISFKRRSDSRGDGQIPAGVRVMTGLD